MNVSEKRAIQGMIEQRAQVAQSERTMPGKPTPPARLVERVQKAHDAASFHGWNVQTPGYNAGTEITLTPAPNNAAAKADRYNDQAILAAIEAAKDAAIIELWTTDDFDLAAVFATIDASKRT